MRLAAALGVMALACAHAPPKATVLGGKRVGLGELVGDDEVKAVMKDAIAERFDLGASDTPELHLHVDASMSAFDEPVMMTTSGTPPGGMMPMQYRRVQTLRATLRLVEDATGAVLAVGVYDLLEKGPERPRDSRAGDELGTILARRVVRQFIEQHKL